MRDVTRQAGKIHPLSLSYMDWIQIGITDLGHLLVKNTGKIRFIQGGPHPHPPPLMSCGIQAPPWILAVMEQCLGATPNPERLPGFKMCYIRCHCLCAQQSCQDPPLPRLVPVWLLACSAVTADLCHWARLEQLLLGSYLGCTIDIAGPSIEPWAMQK